MQPWECDEKVREGDRTLQLPSAHHRRSIIYIHGPPLAGPKSLVYICRCKCIFTHWIINLLLGLLCIAQVVKGEVRRSSTAVADRKRVVIGLAEYIHLHQRCGQVEIIALREFRDPTFQRPGASDLRGLVKSLLVF